MKRCPTCNRTFEEDWLAFCTQDGATLVQESPARANEPPPTILSSAPPPLAGDWMQPSGGLGSGQFQPQPQVQAGWQPPPPPPYAQGPKQGLAVASMICGIFSVTVGWCCYLGVVSSPIALGLGIYQLIQI